MEYFPKHQGVLEQAGWNHFGDLVVEVAPGDSQEPLLGDVGEGLVPEICLLKSVFLEGQAECSEVQTGHHTFSRRVALGNPPEI